MSDPPAALADRPEPQASPEQGGVQKERRDELKEMVDLADARCLASAATPERPGLPFMGALRFAQVI